MELSVKKADENDVKGFAADPLAKDEYHLCWVENKKLNSRTSYLKRLSKKNW